MIILLSLVTSAKDYFEIVHKLIEVPLIGEAYKHYNITDYTELGSLISYSILTVKNFFTEIFSLNWLQNLWSLPIIVPDIASAMISEISVLDGYFHNALTFLETPLSYGKQNYSIYGLERLLIGLINSFFLFLPTSAAHMIMLRRFVFQGIEAGYIAGFGIIAGNLLWLASIIFGWRFFVIPWLSLDILRYLLGFVILIKYMWHASHDQGPSPLTNLSKSKIFLVTFLLALTEQTNLYPFVTNMSIGAESTILEIFPVENLAQFIFIHSAYLLGIFAGSLSLLHLTCWLWENPIYKIYLWLISNSNFLINLPKIPKQNYYKYLNFIFLYLTMLCTISSIPYFGLDYTLTNPLGLVPDDLVLTKINKKTNQPEFPELSFLTTQASDRNTRDARGRHGRRERWKDRLIKYRGMDTSLYDQSVYDLFTIEDLNYGFDKFWLRRKIKNHHSRFRMVIFQPWLLSLKKQLAKPRLITNEGVRIEFFRMLYEQFYHPNFHAYLSNSKLASVAGTNLTNYETTPLTLNKITTHEIINKSESSFITTIYKQDNTLKKASKLEKNKLENTTLHSTSALRKFVRKMNTRTALAQILLKTTNVTNMNKAIYSKNLQFLISPSFTKVPDFSSNFSAIKKLNLSLNQINKHISNKTGLKDKDNLANIIKKKDRQILRYKTLLSTTYNPKKLPIDTLELHNAQVMLHPIKFYLQKEKAFKRKWKFYGANIFRKLSIENNAPSFRVMMKRLFYYYKPTLRWSNTLKLAKNKQGHKVRRKKSRTPLRYAILPSLNNITTNESLNKQNGNNLNYQPINFGKQNALVNLKSVSKEGPLSSLFGTLEGKGPLSTKLIKPTHNYRLVGKNASKMRAKIYKDVLHHWYYTPFNRLLLKFDIDAFIRRQPNSHFLTKNEEQELHLKRFLLSEHYDTLRWYTYMQHYRSMKTNIGGTKSFASKIYNHQFQGTFKKIRHLFAITPTISSDGSLLKSQTFLGAEERNVPWLGTLPEGKKEPLALAALSVASIRRKELQEQDNFVTQQLNIKPVLKFDQPLYNEYSNTQKKSIIKESVIHEELLSNYNKNLTNSISNNNFAMNDLITESTLIVKNYLKTSKEKRQIIIKNFLMNKNYKELTKFFFTGQKTRGLKATTNQVSLNKQENEYLNLIKQSLPPSLTIEKMKHSQKSVGTKFNSKKPPMFPITPSRVAEPIALPSSLTKQGNEKTPSLLSQHDSFLSNSNNKKGFLPSFTEAPKEGQLIKNNSYVSKFNTKRKVEQDLWFSFLINYKKGLYDQEFLTKFLERRIKKKEKRQQKKEKELKNRLKRLKIWLAPNPSWLTSPSFAWPGSQTKQVGQAASWYGNQPLPSPTLSKKDLVPSDLLRESSPLKAEEGIGEILQTNKNANFYFLTTGMKKAIQDGVLNIKKEPQNLITVLDNKNSIFNNSKIEQTEALPNSLNSIYSILIKLNNEKKLKKQNKNFINNAEMFAYTTFLKTKIISHVIAVKIKALIKLSFNITKKKFVKPLLQKDPILTWEIQENMLKKRKRSRKKYTKAIKDKAEAAAKVKAKAKTTLIKESALLNQNSSLTANKSPLLTSSLNERVGENKTFSLVLDQPRLVFPSHQLSKKNTLLTPVKIEKANFAYPNVALTLNNQKIETGGAAQSALFLSDSTELYQGAASQPIIHQGKEWKQSKDRNKKNNSFKQIELINKKDLKIYTLSLFTNQKNKKWLGNTTSERNSKREINNSDTLISFKTTDSKNSSGTEKRKKKLSENEITLWSIDKLDTLNLNKKEINFLYFNTLSGAKLGITQKFKRKNTKIRRNILYARPYHRVEHPSFNANLDRKSANMVPEKRVQILKEQAKLNYGLTSFNNNNEPIMSFAKNKSNLALNPKKIKSKKRTWQKYKKRINNAKLRKARQHKHNRGFIAEQRTKLLTKQMKRIKLNLKLQKWWWKQFLPNVHVTQSSTLTTESNWQLEKERQLKKTISKLSKTEILERDFINVSNGNPELQIGDYDFKPLAIPQALRIQLANQPKTTINQYELENNNKTNHKQNLSPSLNKHSTVYNNKTMLALKETTNKQFILPTNPLPFYAGWDESLRKLVVTNRLLSRREAGYSISEYNNNNNNNIIKRSLKPFPFNILRNKIEFTNSPLQGMNAGTTLYCQIPFSTFDPDQLFSRGMDGFAPLGWRRFDFTHTIFKTQFLLKKNLNDQSKTFIVGNQDTYKNSNTSKPLVIQKLLNPLLNEQSPLSLKLQRKLKQINFKKYSQDFDTIKKYTNYSRRLKKHYKRIKKLQTEKVPIFLISGPLINEVLPIHYINVFNKQNRLSKDRYLKRRLRRGKKGIPKAIKEFTTKNTSQARGLNSQINPYTNKSDLTLRRRLKTRRKYHRKPYPTKGIVIQPRRHKFLTTFNTKLVNKLGIEYTFYQKIRKRPSKRKLKKNTAKQNQSRDYDGNLTSKKRQRQKIKKTGALNARLRQLRRRVSRYVLKTVPRRRPRAGGFIWPGDYLRLEQTESPKLILKNKKVDAKFVELPTLSNEKLGADKLGLPNKAQEPLITNLQEDNLKESNKQKITRKIDKKASLLDLYVQPRKYLLEKHNIKVIKKKLEKAQRPNL
nr:hypothetical chloroplast RF1 [Chloromonas rosae]